MTRRMRMRGITAGRTRSRRTGKIAKPFVDRGRHLRCPTCKNRELRGAIQQYKQELTRKDAEIAMLRRGIMTGYALVKPSWSFAVPNW